MKTITVPSKEQEYLKIFQKVTKLISMVLDPQQVMDMVVHRLPEILDVDAATIRLLDSSTNTFVLGAAHGLSDEYLSRGSIDTEESMEMIMSGNPVAKTDLAADPRYKHSAEATREGIKSVLALPITFQGHIIGIMRLLTRSQRVFTAMEISFSMALAEQVGVAISNARLFTEMENQVDFLKEVKEISRLVNSTLNLSEILQTIVDKLPKIMGLKACTIRLLQPETNQLELVAAVGLSDEYLKRGQIKRENSIFCALKGEPVAIYDAPNDARVRYHDSMEKEGIKSILAVPIKNGPEIIGVLRLLTAEHHCFTTSEVNFAATLAEEGGNAIQNARTYQKINLLFNQIEENERFLQDILDSLWAQLIVLDTQKHVVMANRRFLEENAFTEGEIMGRPYNLISPWGISDDNMCPVDQILSSGEKTTNTIHRVKEGNDQWLEQSIYPILDDKGKVEFVIFSVRDITTQQLLEQEKMERIKLKGILEIAGTVAHELNSPLFAALGTAQLMRDDIQSEALLEDLNIITRNMKQMAELTKKMITMTGFETKDYVGEAKIVELK